MNASRHVLGKLSASKAVWGSVKDAITTSALPASSALFSSAASPAAANLYSACVFERLPVVMPLPPQWEVEYLEWQANLMTKKFKVLPKELTEDNRRGDDGPGASADSQWKPEPRETPADRSGDRSTTRRRLDERIFMLVKRRDGAWEFPHVQLQAGETTRAGAERALEQVIGSQGFQPYFVGNAPAGHVALDQGKYFFHRCQLIQGTPSLAGGAAWMEMVWAAKDELKDYIKDSETLDLLLKML